MFIIAKICKIPQAQVIIVGNSDFTTTILKVGRSKELYELTIQNVEAVLLKWFSQQCVIVLLGNTILFVTHLS
jgi:hypothetical protein